MDRCPYVKGVQAGDEGMDFCELTNHMCDLELGETCDEWGEIKGEDNDRTGSKS